MCLVVTLTKAKPLERYGNFRAICDPHVALIWDSQMVVWHLYGVIFCSFPQYGKYMGWKVYIRYKWENYGDDLPIQIPCLLKFFLFSLDMDFIRELHFLFFKKKFHQFLTSFSYMEFIWVH